MATVKLQVTPELTTKFYDELMRVFIEFDFTKAARIMDEYGYTWYISDEEKERFELTEDIDYFVVDGHHCIPTAYCIKRYVKDVFERLWDVMIFRGYIEMEEATNGLKYIRTEKNIGRFIHQITVTQQKDEEPNIEISLSFIAETV